MLTSLLRHESDQGLHLYQACSLWCKLERNQLSDCLLFIIYGVGVKTTIVFPYHWFSFFTFVLSWRDDRAKLKKWDFLFECTSTTRLSFYYFVTKRKGKIEKKRKKIKGNIKRKNIYIPFYSSNTPQSFPRIHYLKHPKKIGCKKEHRKAFLTFA